MRSMADDLFGSFEAVVSHQHNRKIEPDVLRAIVLFIYITIIHYYYYFISITYFILTKYGELFFTRSLRVYRCVQGYFAGVATTGSKIQVLESD